MAKHEIVIHENTSATRTAAPYLGSYISKETVKLDGYANAIAAKCGLPAIQVQALIAGAFEAWEGLEKESLVRIHTDLGCICGVITGSFATSDAAFDPAVNALELALRLDDSIRLELADTVPVIATDESITKRRLDNCIDVETQKPYNLIHGNKRFRLQGFNMVAGGEDWSAAFVNTSGTRFPFVIDEDVTKQLKIGHLDPVPPEGCDGKVVITSKAGDAEGPLQTAFRKVKFLSLPKPKLAINEFKARKIGDITAATMQIENAESSLGYVPEEGNVHTRGFVSVNGGEFNETTLVYNGDSWGCGLADVEVDDVVKLAVRHDPAKTAYDPADAEATDVVEEEI